MGPPNEHWQIRKSALACIRGVVAAQIFSVGGNAVVDPTVATGFTLHMAMPICPWTMVAQGE